MVHVKIEIRCDISHLVRDVEDEYECVGGSVVALRDGAEALLSGRVPDLQLDLLALHLDRLDHEVDADGGALPRREHALREPAHQARLAHASVAHQHHLEEVLVVLHRRHLHISEMLN